MRGFSSILLALLVMALVAVAVAVPGLYILTSRMTRITHTALADAIAAELSGVAPQQRPAAMEELQRRHEDVTVSFDFRQMQPGSVGGVEYRLAGNQMIAVRFRDTLAATRGLFRFAAMAAVVAVIAAVSLLVMNLLSMMSSRGAAADSAEDASPGSHRAYLLDTFESSIRTLKYRESELARMHEDEKARANALAAVTTTLVRSLSSGFVSFDETGHVIDLNIAARELLGEAAPAAAGMTLNHAGSNACAAALQDAVDHRLTLHRHEIEDPASRTVIDIMTVPLIDERGRFFGMLALLSDVTPIRRLERSVRELETLAALGEMSAGIAHEFRNSLSTITGYLRLARKAALPADAETRLARAEDEAHLLAQAIESLLSFARPVKLQQQPVDVLALASDVVSRNATHLAGIEVHVEGDPFVIDADPALLRRAVENLVRNAADAIRSKPGGQGTVTLTSSAAGRRLIIADDGAGLEPEIAPRLFLPFQSTKPHGFGLGLALVKKIVLLHGGAVSLRANEQGGATAVIEFGTELRAAPSGSGRGPTVTFCPNF